MPRRLRWLVPIAACALPCAEASAAPAPTTELPIPPVEARVESVAQAQTRRAIAAPRQRVRDRRHEVDGVLRAATAQIGDGYAWGGSGPDAFDCSGLTAFAFARAGIA